MSDSLLMNRAERALSLDFPVGKKRQTNQQQDVISRAIDREPLRTGRLEHKYEFTANDLEDLGEIGKGAYGTVNKMRHKKSDTVMAVKLIRAAVDNAEQSRLLMDLDVVRESNFEHIVRFYGALFMETVKALDYLKNTLSLIHRDVKPSNILLSSNGDIKLCDFGISGQLVDSIAKTRDAGCRPYMAPERIDPNTEKSGYDVRSDVWSLAITMVEAATGKFPYPEWNSVFEQLQQVVHGDPPRLTDIPQITFSQDFKFFISTCLQKNREKRLKYSGLLESPFLRDAQRDKQTTDMSSYVKKILDQTKITPLPSMDN